MDRNAELLHMLDEVDKKAAALATKTERLKKLKVKMKKVFFIESHKNKIVLNILYISMRGKVSKTLFRKLIDLKY